MNGSAEGGGASSDAPPSTLGPRAEVYEQLAAFNTHPDVPDGDVLYGPGISIQIPWVEGDITQMLLRLTDEDIAWAVLNRMCRENNWQLVDLETGRTLTFS